MSEKKRKKHGLSQAIAKETGIPVTAIANVFHIEFFGGNHAEIEGCRGVLKYEESCIELDLGDVTAVFRGSELEILSYNENRIDVGGVIAVTEFLS